MFPEVEEILNRLIASFRKEIIGAQVAETVRHGFEVAIVGAPNAGKSSLINALSGRDAAIISEIAGTTRDVIEVRMDVHGLNVVFLDTAGLRETDDKIESLGVDRARTRANGADMRLFLGPLDGRVEYRTGDLMISPKSDLGLHGDGLPVSSKTGQGIDDVLSDVARVLSERVAQVQSSTRRRHALALQRASDALDLARANVRYEMDAGEIVAEDIRRALRAVESLVGHIGVEHVLGDIFSSFCIGK